MEKPQKHCLLHKPPMVPLADEDLLKYQWALIAVDLPVLDPNQLQHGAQHIAMSIGILATETHLAQEEAVQA